ncbi:hypothetical protein LO772_17685 [Yinghuangia sp. ASG 101]|uniref:hypothetical protein n=1 Tax=Yinghuangia sp. ASG 101 TaxID=2896848 RepID=UPI001E43294C|nr:hypothetical protein [Yinghuangia sp. ASG 101]UGQ15230.1 hypothetical protein LO772_17685 [Yinghuangia sp. ASG 101]
MRTVRAFVRRVPMGPVVIALLMVGVLTLVNFYGSHGGGERAAPSEPVGIPPQLPAEEHAPPEPEASPATPLPPSDAVPAPPVAPAPDVTTAGSLPSALPSPGASPAAPRQDDPPATAAVPPQAPAQVPANPPQDDDARGDDPGRPVETYSTAPFKVVGVVLTGNRGTGAVVRCAGRDEVMVTATVLVDGGEGDVVYQWYFDDVRSWPPDQLHFTGDGQRQQSLTIPWPVGIRYSGARIKATVQLRILQPVVNAQTHKINIDLVCL